MIQDHEKLKFGTIFSDKKSSFLQKYMDLTIGERSLLALLKFEVITFLFGQLTGVVGLSLRYIFYPFLFEKTGKKIIFGNHVSLNNSKKISLGNNVVINDYSNLSVRGFGNEKIEIKDNVLIGRGCEIKTRAGTVLIDEHANLGSECKIGSTSKVYIGKYCLFAARCYIGGTNHDIERTDIPIVQQPLKTKGGVRIEEDVWLGANVIVIDGVTIGKGSVIGAGSVVTRDIPPYSIAFGSPAKVYKSRILKE